jgi:hypothetical protein
VDQNKMIDEKPLEGTEEIPWELPEVDFIVVDDLDEGLLITEEDEKNGLRLGARAVETETDQGLPVLRFGLRSTWSRMVHPGCWGKYRHTMAVVEAGSGKRRALFTANLPRAGRWDLELHLPGKPRLLPGKWGAWNLAVLDGSDRNEVTFDADAGARGWNLAGTFELPRGEIQVELSDRTSGEMVAADAIRWSPAAGKKGGEEK